MKFKRIAVVLIGYLRTFPFLNKHYHAYFHSMADQVDYILITWNRPNINSDGIIDYGVSTYFKNNLKKLVILDPDNYNFNSEDRTLKLCFLAKKGAEEKTLIEKNENFTYDYVIETRPDLYFTHRTDLNFDQLIDNQIIALGGAKFDNGSRKWDSESDNIDDFSLGDWYFRMNSKTYDLFSNRYEFYKNNNIDTTVDFHKELKYFFNATKILKIHPGEDWKEFLAIGCLPDRLRSIPKL